MPARATSVAPWAIPRSCSPCCSGKPPGMCYAGSIRPRRNWRNRSSAWPSSSTIRCRCVEAHAVLGTILVMRGALEAGCTHLEAGLALYSPAQHRAHVDGYGQDPASAACTF